MREKIVILDAARTPFVKSFGDKIPAEQGGDGKQRRKGAFADIPPVDLMAAVFKALLERNPEVAKQDLSDVIVGCALQSGEAAGNLARFAALMAGIPESVPAMTITRICSSSMQAASCAAEQLLVGSAWKASRPRAILVGGVESMSRTSMADWAKPSALFRKHCLASDADGISMLYMGLTAENLARRHRISRSEQHEFAYGSHRKAAQAQDSHKFVREIIPVHTRANGVQREDIGPRRYPSRQDALTAMGRLRPSFIAKSPFSERRGTVDPSTASVVSDGAAGLIIATESYARQAGAKPLAEIVSWAYAGVEPKIMGMGPVPSSKMALERAGLGFADIGALELNEAFAAQCLAVKRGFREQLQLREDRFDELINQQGGAIALGHPLGASGARLLGTLAYIMKDRQAEHGLATLCVGMGQGGAMVLRACAN